MSLKGRLVFFSHVNTEETEKVRTLLYTKWNEIVTKFCRNVSRYACHGIVTGFNVKHLDTFGHEIVTLQYS